jgi:hypothetical protein
MDFHIKNVQALFLEHVAELKYLTVIIKVTRSTSKHSNYTEKLAEIIT